jgi:hypothetical protein
MGTDTYFRSEGVHEELLRQKYLWNKTLSQVEAKPTDSSIWKGLKELKKEFFDHGSFFTSDGTCTFLGG